MELLRKGEERQKSLEGLIGCPPRNGGRWNAGLNITYCFKAARQGIWLQVYSLHMVIILVTEPLELLVALLRHLCLKNILATVSFIWWLSLLWGWIGWASLGGHRKLFAHRCPSCAEGRILNVNVTLLGVRQPCFFPGRSVQGRYMRVAKSLTVVRIRSSFQLFLLTLL